VGLCFLYASCTGAFGVFELCAAVIHCLLKSLSELLRALFLLFDVIQVKQWGMWMSIDALWGASHGLQLIEI